MGTVAERRGFPTIQGDEHGRSRTMVALLFAVAVLSWSPIWTAWGVRGIHWVAGAMTLAALHSTLSGRPIKRWTVLGSATVFALAAVPALYWADMRLVATPMYLVASLALLAQSTRADISRAVDVSSWFLLAVLVGAVFGFILAQAGLQPVFQILNPDGRPNYLYGTTLANSVFGRVIRPSGVYDEPGALSFVVCLVAFMRHALAKDYRTTWLMLILGFITLSLAHLIFVAVFILAEPFSPRRALVVTGVIGLAAAAVVTSGVDEVFRQRLLARAAITQSGELVGDNRTALMRNAADAIRQESHVAAVGISPVCSFNPDACIDRYGSVCCNPLTPLVRNGMLIAWPYYILLLAALGAGLRGRSGLAFIAVAMLFTQRPGLLGLGYSTLGVLALWLQLRWSSTNSYAARSSSPLSPTVLSRNRA